MTLRTLGLGSRVLGGREGVGSSSTASGVRDKTEQSRLRILRSCGGRKDNQVLASSYTTPPGWGWGKSRVQSLGSSCYSQTCTYPVVQQFPPLGIRESRCLPNRNESVLHQRTPTGMGTPLIVSRPRPNATHGRTGK